MTIESQSLLLPDISVLERYHISFVNPEDYDEERLDTGVIYRQVELLCAINYYLSDPDRPLDFPDGTIIEAGAGHGVSTAAVAQTHKNGEMIGVDNGSSPYFKDKRPGWYGPIDKVNKMISPDDRERIVLMFGEINDFMRLITSDQAVERPQLAGHFMTSPPKGGFVEPHDQRKSNKIKDLTTKMVNTLKQGGKIAILGDADSEVEKQIMAFAGDSSVYDVKIYTPQRIVGKTHPMPGYNFPEDESIFAQMIEVLTQGRSDMAEIIEDSKKNGIKGIAYKQLIVLTKK